MALVYLGPVTVNGYEANATPLSGSVTLPSGTTYAVAMIQAADDLGQPDTTSVTLDGTGMTSLGTQTDSTVSGVPTTLQMFGLANPTAGSSITCSAAFNLPPFTALITVACFSGQDTTTPAEGFKSSNGTSTSPVADVTTTTVSGDIVLGHIISGSAGTANLSTADTQISEIKATSAVDGVFATAYQSVTGSGAEINWTSDNDTWVTQAIVIKAAAGASSQDLTPSLFTNTNSFYGPTVTAGTVTLTPSLFTNTNTFYSATVDGVVAGVDVDLFKASGGVTSLFPTTSWVAPNGLFGTTDRNDNTVYSYADSTATVTIPSTGLADGYLVIARYELEATHNNRSNPQAKIVQASGTGTFAGGATGGYTRDDSEDRAYVHTWAFVDNPSASSTFQFQWRMDTGAGTPAGGTVRSALEVIPFYYSDVGIYSSTDASLYGGTTPNQVTGFTGTDGTNITMASNVISVTGDNKRYLALGSQFFEGFGGRTQRWHGFRIDGTKDDSAKAYSYYRDTSNDESGDMFTTIIETSTATRTIDQFCYLGDGVANGDGGADIDGSTPSVGQHVIVVLELNDTTEVFRSRAASVSSDLSTSPTDLVINETTDFNDTNSFTDVSTSSINCVVTGDYLFGANVSAAANNVSATQRWTAYAELTINGIEDADLFAGDYLRNNQGTQDTFGWSANFLGFQSLTAGDDVGVSVTELAGTENGGNPISPAGWSGLWGLNLQTLPEVATGAQPLTPSLFTNTNSFYTPAVTRGAVALTPNLFSNTNTFYSATVSAGAVTLSPSLFTNTNTFYSATVAVGAATLSPSLFTNSNTFDTHSINVGAVGLTASLLSNTQSFYNSVVSIGAVTLTPSLLTNSQTFYAPSVLVGAVTVLPGLFANSNTFYGATLTQGSGLQELTPSLFTNSNTIYSVVVTSSYEVTPSLYNNSNAFYTQTVTASYTVNPSLFSNTIQFFNGTVTVGGISLNPSLFANENVFYGSTVSQGAAPQELAPSLLNNSNTLYGVTITAGGVELSPALLINANVFYGSVVSQASEPQHLTASLFSNTNTFYSSTVTIAAINLAVDLYTNTTVFYNASVVASYTVSPSLFSNSNSFYPSNIVVGGVNLSPSLFNNISLLYAAEIQIGADEQYPLLGILRAYPVASDNTYPLSGITRDYPITEDETYPLSGIERDYPL